MKEITSEERQLIILQIFGIFIVPVLLIYFNIIPQSWRLIVLLMAGILIYGIIRHEKWTLADVGISTDTSKKYFLPYVIATLVGLLFIILIAKNMHMTPEKEWWRNPNLSFLFLFKSFIQEFGYRGFLIPKLKKVFSDKFGIILINALLFTFLHILYAIPQVMLPITFLAGLAFAWLYIKYPNLILISIVHSVLNFVAVLYGFFTISQ